MSAITSEWEKARRTLDEARADLARIEAHPMRRNGGTLFRDRNGVDQILRRAQEAVRAAEAFITCLQEQATASQTRNSDPIPEAWGILGEGWIDD